MSQHGVPPAWRREPGFGSLVYAIIEQQVSLAAARAIYERLVAQAGDLTAERFAAVSEEELRAIGFSRRKIEYCRGLAHQIVSCALDLADLDTAPDRTIRETLTALRGIGDWTADVYLLHSLGRPDVWPVGDLALRIAIQEELGLHARPSHSEVAEIGEAFRPWRSVAARVFWHGYLCRRGIAEVT